MGSLDEVDTSFTYSGTKVASETTSDLDNNYNLIPRGGLAFEYDQTGRRTAIKLQNAAGANVATTAIAEFRPLRPT